MPEMFWLIAIVGGPVLLGLAFWYGIEHGRRLTRREYEAGQQATRRNYEQEAGSSGR
jgi:hypothetical protein